MAIGAALQSGKDGPVAVGLARYVRRTDRPDIAEAAITVVDTFQHRGIGTLLMSRLCAAALQHGIHWFECEFLAENRNIDSLIRRLSPQATFETLEAGIVRAVIPLEPGALEQSDEHKALAPPPDPSPGTARRLGLLFKRKGSD